jgi:putative PIG3 family NAD(P)H quinone oxidoreductase
MKTLSFKDTFSFVEKETPEPSAEEILIHVHAFGINYADLLQKKGKYPPPPGASDILGLEVAGTVEGVGKSCQRFKEGDRVMALVQGGGYATYVAVDERLCMPIPENLLFTEAAALPESFLTAYQALFLIGELQPEQTVLIHAGGSGVGTAAIQLAKAAGARVIITTRTQEKLIKCLELGADSGFNTQAEPFADKLLEGTEGHGADLILDFVGADYYKQNIEVLATGGALIFLATLGGHLIKEVDLRLLIKRWATLTGTTLRSRPIAYRRRLVAEFEQFAATRLLEGSLKPVLHGVFPWEEIQEAHTLLADHQAFGKLVCQTQ